jgi:hypothetical protein
LQKTYDLSLAILFLDRLGDKQDEPLIRLLAGRLIGGQNEVGGWTYDCPVLPPTESQQLLTFLKQDRPEPFLKGITPEGAGGRKPPTGEAPDPLLQGISPDPKKTTESGGSQLLPIEKQPTPGGTKTAKETGLVNPLTPVADPKEKPASEPTPPAKKAPPKQRRITVEQLPPLVRALPIISNAPSPFTKQRGKKHHQTRDDNSNSQFAMIALWVARRHDVPVDRVMHKVHSRYKVSQQPDGGWHYWFQQPQAAHEDPRAMTCVGLIGLAMGHGSAQELHAARLAAGKLPAKKAKDLKPTLEDPAIQLALRRLGKFVGNPSGGSKDVPMDKLYFLWSLERVAVLYNLKTIGGHDWYGWAAEMLLTNQQVDGKWSAGGYPGSTPTIDTCLALLILKRSNLVPDLSENLRFYLAISDPDARK